MLPHPSINRSNYYPIFNNPFRRFAADQASKARLRCGSFLQLGWTNPRRRSIPGCEVNYRLRGQYCCSMQSIYAFGLHPRLWIFLHPSALSSGEDITNEIPSVKLYLTCLDRVQSFLYILFDFLIHQLLCLPHFFAERNLFRIGLKMRFLTFLALFTFSLLALSSTMERLPPDPEDYYPNFLLPRPISPHPLPDSSPPRLPTQPLRMYLPSPRLNSPSGRVHYLCPHTKVICVGESNVRKVGNEIEAEGMVRWGTEICNVIT
jgi:hypothetical protein